MKKNHVFRFAEIRASSYVRPCVPLTILEYLCLRMYLVYARVYMCVRVHIYVTCVRAVCHCACILRAPFVTGKLNYVLIPSV